MVKPGEVWQSKESELLAKVVRVSESAVWYTIPEYSTHQGCEVNLWLASMQKTEAIA